VAESGKGKAAVAQRIAAKEENGLRTLIKTRNLMKEVTVSGNGAVLNGDNDSASSSLSHSVFCRYTPLVEPSERNDDEEQSDASSLSSTPILAFKRMKEAKQRDPPMPTSTKKNSTRPTAAKKQSFDSNRKKKMNADTAASNKQKARTSGATALAAGARTKGIKSGTNADDGSASSSSTEEEEAACCLCFCGVDCSDRALFFPKDRKEEIEDDEDYYFGMEDPYLDEHLYDRNNALVYCDSCNRLYHQKCHFVPLLIIPRGDWNCLICSIQQQSKQKNAAKNANKKRKRSGSKTENSRDDESLPIHDKVEWKKFLDRKLTDHLFQTPTRLQEIQANYLPNAVIDVKALQDEWELASAVYKAQLWHRQLKQFRTFLSSQASNIRRTNTALATMTSTKRNRQHFSGKGSRSQELAQTIVHQTGAKFKIRDAFISLETLRIRDEPVDFSCLVPWCKQHPEHAAHVFPFGNEKWQKDRRIVPRTQEREIEKSKGHYIDLQTVDKIKHESTVPLEINVSEKKDKMASKSPGKSLQTTKKSCQSKTNPSGAKAKNQQHKEEDDDSGISLDNLRCSVCMIGDSTDENDVILCDGQNCHRAFHMKCVYPALSMDDLENENDDWFCPICTGVSTLMGEMHDLCIGSEDPDIDVEDGSLASWDDVVDIFPDSEWEFQTATKLLKGKQNEDTQRLLASYLGEDIVDQPVQMPIGSDSEDENDYSLFDEESFEERKRKDREVEEKFDSDESTRSSEATLVEMSSVEGVGKDELEALAADRESPSCESSDDDSDNDSGEGRMRKSRRLQNRPKVGDDESRSIDNGADFSEANIIEGKRRRNKVDYRKLNDALFGDLDEKQKSQIDDKDDFKVERRSAKKRKSSDGSDNDSNESHAEDSSRNSSGSEESENDSDSEDNQSSN
jgi:PHD-finger